MEWTVCHLDGFGLDEQMETFKTSPQTTSCAWTTGR